MRLLHICTDYTYTKLYYELFSRLENNEKINQQVYVPASFNTKNEKKDNGEKYPVIFSKIYGRTDRLLFMKKEKKFYKDIKSKVDLKNVDKIHAHTLFSAGYTAYKLKKEYNIPYIVSVRSTDVNAFFKYRKNLKQIGLKILKDAEKIVCISETYRDILLEKYIPKNLKNEIESKLLVIHNGIDKFWLDNCKNKTEEPTECLNLVQTGLLIKRKNLKNSIKVVNKLNELGIRTRLYVVGDGPLYNKYKSKFESDSIVFKGRLSKEEIIKLYEQMNIFILPSIRETFGLVYAEAMSQGLPILYTRREGFDGIFPEGEVRLFNKTK